jgi:hypothetical protein
MGQALTISDIHALPLAHGIDAADMREVKSDILRRAREAAALRARGSNGLARRVAKETAAEYRHYFDTDGPKPVNPDNLTPSELADLIRKRPGA